MDTDTDSILLATLIILLVDLTWPLIKKQWTIDDPQCLNGNSMAFRGLQLLRAWIFPCECKGWLVVWGCQRLPSLIRLSAHQTLAPTSTRPRTVAKGLEPASAACAPKSRKLPPVTVRRSFKILVALPRGEARREPPAWRKRSQPRGSGHRCRSQPPTLAASSLFGPRWIAMVEKGLVTGPRKTDARNVPWKWTKSWRAPCFTLRPTKRLTGLWAVTKIDRGFTQHIPMRPT